MNKKHKGSIRISRISSNVEPDYINIGVIDEKSGVHFCDINMSIKDFAEVLFSRSSECEFELRGLHNVGKRRINETRVIEHKGGHDKKSTEKTLAKHEKDGWFARRGDLGNVHRSAGSHKYRVVFFKYVDSEADDKR